MTGKPEPRLMLVAMYEGDLNGALHNVCLGIRIGGPDDVVRLERLLLKQVRDRYPELFQGMKPKQIETVVDILVYDTKPTLRGFPTWIGDAYWWHG
jgi:hypothetical protein